MKLSDKLLIALIIVIAGAWIFEKETCQANKYTYEYGCHE